jgi:citrate synthase
MSLQDLLAAENNLTTHMGKAFLSERVVLRGLDLHHDLVNQHSWFAVHLYAVTGRFFEPKQLTLLEYLWSCTSYPDASIWPNNTAL